MTWQTIPQAPRYEINSQGVVRNRQTGYVLKWQTRNVSNKQISLRDDNGKSVCLSYPSLILQLFGERVGKTTRVPVNIVKGNQRRFFDSCRQCSFFLAKAVPIPLSTVWNKLARRHEFIGGWRVDYLL